MRKLALALLLCSAAKTADVGTREYIRDLIEFNNAFGVFSRAMFGCPPDASEVSECDLKRGSIDYAAYLKAAKLSKKVQEFPCQGESRK